MNDTEKNEIVGGLAFPQKQPGGTEISGMTLMDWFAGQALASMSYDWFDSRNRAKDMAEEAYNIADAMLEERKI